MDDFTDDFEDGFDGNSEDDNLSEEDAIDFEHPETDFEEHQPDWISWEEAFIIGSGFGYEEGISEERTKEKIRKLSEEENDAAD